MYKRGVYEEGDDIDFDQINEQNSKNISSHELVRAANADIDTKNISAGKAYELYSDVSRKLELAHEKKDINIVETPKEKFNRLHNEFEELRKELEFLAQKEEKEKDREGSDLPIMFREIESLQKELAILNAKDDFKKVLETETAETLNADEHIVILRENLDYQKSENLLNMLKEIQRQGGDADAKNVNYKIALNDAPEKIRQELRLTDLQRRIGNLEKILGNTSSNEVIEGVQKLDKMTELLLEPSLDSLLGRITYISQQMDRLGSKKQSLNLDEEKLIKVERAYESYTTVEKTGEQIPQIINRLESLKVIHEESAKITNKVNKLKDSQAAILVNLGDNQSFLQKIEESFGKNLSVIEANIKSLQERVTKLGK